MDDLNNPAVTSQLAIDPRFLQAVVDDPKLLKALQTKLYVLHMHQMHTRMRDPNAPIGAKQGFLDHLAKAADLNPKEAANAGKAGPGFSVNIVLGGAAPKALPKVEVVETKDAADE